VTVHVRGWRNDDGSPNFEIAWDVAIAPLASVERWTQSTWRGDAAVLDSPLTDRVLELDSHPFGSWQVEARIGDRDALRIGGTFIA
jgi:hypothetical protein